MSNYLYISLLSFLFVFNSCKGGQSQQGSTNLSPAQFAEKIKEMPNAPIVDVRTPEEFSNGHLSNAVNIDWNGADFERQIDKLDKSKPVLVYCLSGGRSASAASKMRAMGFTAVYEMMGGMMKWRGEHLPETTSNVSRSTGMTQAQFDALLQSDKLVLVDFYAEWCAPCKKMKPYLEEIAKEKADKVVVVRIDVEANPVLSKAMGIDALPVLQLYKNKSLVWSHTGYVDKAAVLKVL